MIKNLLFILDGYPYGASTSCVFVKKLIVSLTDMGHKCTVIAPRIITSVSTFREIPYHFTDITPAGNPIEVYFPKYFYWIRNDAGIKWSMDNHFSAVRKTIKREKIVFDAVYGHFIFQCGLTAARVGRIYGVKAFLGAGESDKLLPDSARNHGVYQRGLKNHDWAGILASLSGVICVSEWTKKLLFENGFLDTSMEERVTVIPNAVDTNLFLPASRKEAREGLGLNADDFICVFVGAFNDNKGVMRVSEALKDLQDVKTIYIGSGKYDPTGPNTLFCGRCPNEKVAVYLQASDVFVLPTKSEGCCNAILEALCCGIPVISSDRPFNDGILDNTNSIRIEPESIRQIRNAVLAIKNGTVSFQFKADEYSVKYSSTERAERIIRFMEGTT